MHGLPVLGLGAVVEDVHRSASPPIVPRARRGGLQGVEARCPREWLHGSPQSVGCRGRIQEIREHLADLLRTARSREHALVVGNHLRGAPGRGRKDRAPGGERLEHHVRSAFAGRGQEQRVRCAVPLDELLRRSLSGQRDTVTDPRSASARRSPARSSPTKTSRAPSRPAAERAQREQRILPGDQVADHDHELASGLLADAGPRDRPVTGAEGCPVHSVRREHPRALRPGLLGLRSQLPHRIEEILTDRRECRRRGEAPRQSGAKDWYVPHLEHIAPAAVDDDRHAQIGEPSAAAARATHSPAPQRPAGPRVLQHSPETSGGEARRVPLSRSGEVEARGRGPGSRRLHPAPGDARALRGQKACQDPRSPGHRRGDLHFVATARHPLPLAGGEQPRRGASGSG